MILSVAETDAVDEEISRYAAEKASAILLASAGPYAEDVARIFSHLRGVHSNFFLPVWLAFPIYIFLLNAASSSSAPTVLLNQTATIASQVGWCNF
ncbi:hypothetical protein H6P81_009514 [Aristolochia fimbriata]|uniref:Uncharacterized protein n=1 Tax=Aristolochia fimbriata TaxID=158543 RepID=A0AAV7ELK5_ARIFI|nr:hypothetical protein H6P81_009514 [Aristolochia fimbriata]